VEYCLAIECFILAIHVLSGFAKLVADWLRLVAVLRSQTD